MLVADCAAVVLTALLTVFEVVPPKDGVEDSPESQAKAKQEARIEATKRMSRMDSVNLVRTIQGVGGGKG